MEFFKNIGLKLFGKEKLGVDVIPDEDDIEETPDTETQSHIEFINYEKVGFLKIWYLKKYCMHDWHVHQRMKINVNENGVPQQIDDTLVCRKCGKITKITL
jgi:hypothetical protein